MLQLKSAINDALIVLGISFLAYGMKQELKTELENIGLRLKELRLEKGYTSYRDFANKNDIEPKIYWRIEQGISDFKYSSLKRIVEGLGLTVSEFYKGLGKPE